MNFGPSEQQILLQDSLRRYLTDQCPLDKVREMADNADDKALWPGLVDLGIPALRIPEAAGGIDLRALDAVLVSECLGAHVAPSPFLGSAALLPEALRRSGGDHNRLFGQLASGEKSAGIAITHAYGRRGDAGVTANGDRLNGKSLYVMDVNADLYLVADQQSQLFLVSADADGLERRVLATVDRTRQTGELVFNDTPATLINDDPCSLSRVRELGWLMLAADSLGAAQTMIDEAVAYAKERKQFNRTIGSFQAVKHMCAEMTAALEPCRAMVWYAGHAYDEIPAEAPLLAAQSKAHITDVGLYVARTATQVHGGMGFTDLLGQHYWFKRLASNRQWLGSNDLLRAHAATLQGY